MPGRRRSASTRHTREPASASESARLTADADFPSPGTEEVTRRSTVARAGHELQVGAQLPIGLRLHALRIRGHHQRAVLGLVVERDAAEHRKRVTPAMSSSFFSLVSRAWRSAINASPSSAPASSPRPTLMSIRGDTGVLGAVACWVTVTVTVGVSSARAGSIERATFGKWSATVLAINAARSGEVSVAVMSIRTVSVGALALICPASCAVGMPSRC